MEKRKTIDKLDEEIEERLSEIKIDEKIDEEIDRELSRVVAYEIKKRVDEKVVEKIEGRQPTKSKAAGIRFSRINFSSLNPKEGIKVCLKGSCKTILFISLAAYFLIFALMMLCRFVDVGGICLNPGFLGAAPYITLIAAVSLLVSVVIALFSKDQKSALIFVGIIGLPLLIVIFSAIFVYIGLIIIALVFMLQLVQGGRRQR